MTTRRRGEPVHWAEVPVWAEVARLAAERGFQLEIVRDPDHPANPWLRLTDEFDAVCVCGHRRWLHIEGVGCRGQLPCGSSQMQFKPCPCHGWAESPATTPIKECH